MADPSPEHSTTPSSGPGSPDRPPLTRVNSSATSYELDDSAVSGLTLLDALVSLDAHLDYAGRRLLEWREMATSKANAYTTKFKKNETFNRALRATTRDIEVERVELELKKFRKNVQQRVKKVSERWNDAKIVSLRDKLSFFLGVQLLFITGIVLGTRPQYIPIIYTLLGLYLFPLRIYIYRKKAFHYFLFDLCYAVNLLVLLYIWVAPGSTMLFIACYGLSHGPLATAIATWRNSLVFHSLDKVTSLFIHVYPPLVMTTIVHWYPGAEKAFPAVAQLPTMPFWYSMFVTCGLYLVWQLAYYYGIVVARRDRIQKLGRVTSFTWLMKANRGWIGWCARKVPEAQRPIAFMIAQFIYTFVTAAPSPWLYRNRLASNLYLFFFFSVSVWNGASFYLEVFGGKRFEKELVALRSALDELQREVNNKKSPNPGEGTPLPNIEGSPVPSSMADDSADVEAMNLEESEPPSPVVERRDKVE